MVVFRRTSRWSRAASASMTDLVLDPAIRDWVLVPIVIIMFLMGILRNNVTKMMRKDSPPKREQILQNNQLMRARRLRANACYIPAAAFAGREAYLAGRMPKKFFAESASPLKGRAWN